jgi:hypothetical protein
MLTENGVQVDLEAVRRILNEGDVVTIGFTFTPERLLVDTRSKESAGPMVALVAPVTSVQERYLWLGQNRPGFGAPEGFSFFVWPHTARTLIERDVMAPLRARLAHADPAAPGKLNDALATVAAIEQKAMGDAVRGVEPWVTVWSCDKADDV